MKEYTIKVDGKYFVGETMERMQGTVGAGAGNFFGSIGADPHLSAYAYSVQREDAAEMIMFNVLGYIQGIYERSRYLPKTEQPVSILIEETHHDDR